MSTTPQTSETTPAPRASKQAGGLARWAGRLQWVVIPLVMLVLANVFVMRITGLQWYPRVVSKSVERPPDYLFVGSSRTAAAIDADYFAQQRGEGTVAVNLGMGYSTTTQHYLGLEQVIKAAGGRIDGVTVMLEAPRQSRSFTGWEVPWYNADRPMLMDAVMSADRLGGFWASSGEAVEKATITGRWLIRPMSALSIPHRTGHWLERLFSERLPEKVLGPLGDDSQADIVQEAGIRTDAEAVENAKRIAKEWTEQAQRANKRIDFEKDLVILDIVELVRSHGGEVVFYDMPLISFQLELLRTADRRADTQTFHQRLADQGVAVLDPPFQYTDKDLPDFWHLAAGRREDYTHALLQAYEQAGDQSE